MSSSNGSILIPILAYHQVEPIDHVLISKPGLVTSAPSFRLQMLILRVFAYRTISFDDLVSALNNPSAVPKRAVVITFDDGYEGVFRCALPILRHYGFLATCFLIAEDFSRGKSRVNHRAFPILTHTQAAEMIKAGFQVGSHSCTHASLTELPELQAHEEITRAKSILEDTFGIQVNAFAYPYGNSNERVEMQVADAGYASAVTTRFGRSHRDRDRFKLKRIPIGSQQGLSAFLYRLWWAAEQ